MRAFRQGAIRLVRRRTAVRLVATQQPVAAVAALLHGGESMIDAWRQAFIRPRWASGHDRHPAGRPATLTPTQQQRLTARLTAGPEAAGYAAGCWTRTVIHDLLGRAVGVLYTVPYLAAGLPTLGVSYQQARCVSEHRDEARRERGRTREGPAIGAEARRQGALLLVGDEARFAHWGALR